MHIMKAIEATSARPKQRSSQPNDTESECREFSLALLGIAEQPFWRRPAIFASEGQWPTDHGAFNGLAEFGKNPQGGVSRVAYSEADLQDANM
jgi:hypothetical protein